MIKKLAGWAVVAFIAFYLVADPTLAARTARGLISGLVGAGNSLAAFANHLSHLRVS
jgi:hypothetical protein